VPNADGQPGENYFQCREFSFIMGGPIDILTLSINRKKQRQRIHNEFELKMAVDTIIGKDIRFPM